MDSGPASLKNLRTLSHPRAGVQALLQHAPRAEAFGAGILDILRPYTSAVYELRRKLATVAVLLVTAWLFVHVTFGANGMVVYRQKRTEYTNLQKDLSQLQQQNERFSSQIKGLKTDPKLIEKIAREQFHYTKPGEYVLVNPAPAQQVSSGINSARK